MPATDPLVVVRGLQADARFLTVTRQHSRLPRQHQQPSANRGEDGLEVAVGAAGGPWAPLEERVAADQDPELRDVERDSARRMPRRVQHLDRDPTDMQDVALSEQA